MKHPIKHRYTGAVLFEADIPDGTPSGLVVRAALEQATKARAYLAGAYLAGAYLAGADLAGERPIFQVGPIGSRSAYLVAYLTEQGVMLKTGCFIGSVESFKANLQAEHGDNQHAQEYRAALDLIDVHARLWTPSATAERAAAEAEAA